MKKLFTGLVVVVLLGMTLVRAENRPSAMTKERISLFRVPFT